MYNNKKVRMAIKPNLVDFSILERDVAGSIKATFNNKINTILLLLFLAIVGLVFYMSRKQYSREEEDRQTLEQLSYILAKSNEYSVDSRNYISYSSV